MQETQLQQKEILAEKKENMEPYIPLIKTKIDILHFNPRHFLANRRVLCWK